MNTKFSIIIYTLKNMYENKTITISKLNELLDKKSISPDEYNFILGKVVEKDVQDFN